MEFVFHKRAYLTAGGGLFCMEEEHPINKRRSVAGRLVLLEYLFALQAHAMHVILAEGIFSYTRKGNHHATTTAKSEPTATTAISTTATVSAAAAATISTPTVCSVSTALHATKHQYRAAEAATLVPDTCIVLLLHRLVAWYYLGDCCAPLDLYDHSCAHRTAHAQ